MFIHYLKIAFRNMWKYKSQTLISVAGFAVGFTCFALAMLWIVYEMTYDNFHKNAKRIYVVYQADINNPNNFNSTTPNPLASYLKETFPEIADAVSVQPSSRETKMKVDGIEVSLPTIKADASFLRMFDVKILEGSQEFLIPGSNKRAITQEKARQLFGDEHSIGKKINDKEEVCAIVSGMNKRSNYRFDFIAPFSPNQLDPNQEWYVYGVNTIIELLPGIDVKTFEKKLYEQAPADGAGRHATEKLQIMSITKLRYLNSDAQRDVKFQHILIFCLSGLLVVLSSLLNYLTLFVNRLRIRQRELALRVVCGASGGSLLMMLSVEFLLTLLFAIAIGYELTQFIYKPFLTISDVSMELSAVFRNSLLYIGGVMLVSLLLLLLLMIIFRRNSLHASIRRSNKKLFRKISIATQLVISIGFAFCTIIVLKQMYFLHNSDELGFSFQNSGTIKLRNEDYRDVFANQLKQIPEITEIVDTKGISSLIPRGSGIGISTKSWDDMSVDAVAISMDLKFISPEYASFYGLRLLTGEMLTEADPDSVVLINETAVKAFGWHDPVGKKFDNRNTVKGVIKNVYNLAPTVPVKPTCFTRYTQDIKVWGAMYNSGVTLLFKYRKGTWKPTKEKIEQMIKNENDELFSATIYNAEEEYDKYLRLEETLLKLLSVVSAICVLICVFGFVSLVSLTCEERRKEIAIRKINGATSGTILSIFAKEYFLLLIIGAVIAFPAGFLIMQRWLEQYVKQTNIPVWIYLSIICVMALIIVLCVGWRVHKASVENPAEVVKAE